MLNSRKFFYSVFVIFVIFTYCLKSRNKCICCFLIFNPLTVASKRFFQRLVWLCASTNVRSRHVAKMSLWMIEVSDPCDAITPIFFVVVLSIFRKLLYIQPFFSFLNNVALTIHSYKLDLHCGQQIASLSTNVPTWTVDLCSSSRATIMAACLYCWVADDVAPTWMQMEGKK